MDTSNRITEEMAMNSVMENFIRSYAERDKNKDFPNWLAGQFQQEIPGMSPGIGEKLSREIIEVIAKYDQSLADFNRAIESGQSKEGWLSERMIEACKDIPHNDAGRKLQLIYNGMNTANIQLMSEIGDSLGADIITIEADEIIEWNKYSLKDKALNIGRQAVMSSLGTTANIVRNSIIDNSEMSDISDDISHALQEGLETAKNEVKAVVAGAIKITAENKLTDMLPENTPTETICDIACVAVESAEALCDVAMGKSTMVEAIDVVGRASVATICRLGADILKGKLMLIPIAGSVITLFASGLLNHMKSPKFNENVYIVVRDAAKATWDGLKETGREILSGIKKSFKNSLHN